MKIAFIGTHGVGKTTLVYEFVTFLKKKGYNADVLTEIVRRCPFPINEERTLDTQRWILFKQITEEMELCNKNDIVVCDRSSLDSYAYLFSKFGDDMLTLGVVSEWVKTYDLVFKVGINPEFLKEDGIRSVDKDFQKEIDMAVDVLIENLGIKVYNFVSVKDCFEKVLSIKENT